jgi:uncharacterized repeat protein (TIGR01451 family)
VNLKLLSILVLFLILSTLSTARAAILTYPGCDATLQACIDGANPSGVDIIEIATNDRIDESLNISKGVSIRPASGFSPVIGNSDLTIPRLISINDAGAGGGTVVVNLLDLNLDGMKIDVLFDEDTDHEFNMAGCRLVNNEPLNSTSGGHALNLRVVGLQAFSLLSNNFIAGPGDAAFLRTENAGGNLETAILGNTVTTIDPSFGVAGLRVRADAAANLKASILNNVVYGFGQAVFDTCIEAEAQGLNTTASVDANHNTLDDCFWGIRVWHVQGGATDFDLILFNNSFSNSVEAVSYAQQNTPPSTLNNDFNNFFNISSLIFTANTLSSEGPNTLFEDPLYQDAADGNYRLQAGSPLIDAGTNTPPIDLSEFDADHLPRLAGETTDIGAFEAQADLALTKTVSPGSVIVGDTVTYTLTVTNNGPYDTSVTLTDPLPTGTSLQSATATQGTCDDTAPLACSLGVLANGATATVTAVVVMNQTGDVLNNAQVEGDVPDPDLVNNSASAVATVTDDNPDAGSGGCGFQGGAPQAQSLTLLLSLGLIIASMVVFRRAKQS